MWTSHNVLPIRIDLYGMQRKGHNVFAGEISQRVARALQRVVGLKMELFDWLIPQRVVKIRQHDVNIHNEHVAAIRYGLYGLQCLVLSIRRVTGENCC